MAVPQRTCIGCHQVRAKGDLIRIVRSADGSIADDPYGKEKGRGAYVCPNRDCVSEATKPEILNRAFRIAPNSVDCISSETIEDLRRKLLELVKAKSNL